MYKMKKTISLILVIMICFLLVTPLTTSANDLCPDGHTEVVISGYNATCDKPGMTDGTKCSVCGEMLDVPIATPALGHTETEAVKENVIEATSVLEGSYESVVYCSVCGVELSRDFHVIPMLEKTDIETVGGTGTTPVVLTAEAATFKVTVPTALAVEVQADGTVLVADEGATITNLSAGAVKVTDVAIEAANSWELVDYQIDLDEFKVNDKKIGLQLNSANEMTGEDGTFAFDAAKWARLDTTGGTADTYTFEYDAVVAPQSTALTDATVANVIFTIDWDK